MGEKYTCPPWIFERLVLFKKFGLQNGVVYSDEELTWILSSDFKSLFLWLCSKYSTSNWGKKHENCCYSLLVDILSDVLELFVASDFLSEPVEADAVSNLVETTNFEVWTFCLFSGSNVSSELRLCLRVPSSVVLSFIELSSFVEIESDSIGWI